MKIIFHWLLIAFSASIFSSQPFCMENNKPTPAAEEMSRTPFIAEERQTVAGKFAIKNIENGMLQVLYSLADPDEIILIDHKVEILESVKFGKNSEVLSIRTNTGENGAPPSFYLLFLKKKQRWILRPLDLDNSFFDQECVALRDFEVLPKLSKDGKRLEVMIPLREDHEVLDAHFFYELDGNLRELKKPNIPAGRIPETVNFSELNGLPPVAILHYPPVKEVLCDTVFIRPLYKKLKNLWATSLKLQDGEIECFASGSQLENRNRLIVIVTQGGGFFIAIPEGSGLEIISDYSNRQEIIQSFAQNNEVDWFMEAFNDPYSVCRVNGKKFFCSKLLE